MLIVHLAMVSIILGQLTVYPIGLLDFVQLDNFRKFNYLELINLTKMNLREQDKGQRPYANAFVRAISTGGNAPIPTNEIFQVARVALEVIFNC